MWIELQEQMQAGPRMARMPDVGRYAQCACRRSNAMAQRKPQRDTASTVYSPSVSSEAFPPAAVVLIVSVRSVAKRTM